MIDSPLRGEGGALVPSPVLDGIVYGVTAKTLTHRK
jgi:hypothetical protein